MSLRSVVLSPPGMTRASTSASCSGFRTSTTSSGTRLALPDGPVDDGPAAPPPLARPHRSRARAWRAKSPCSARTPTFTARRPSSPAPGLHEVLLGELGGLDARHGLAELLADPGQHVGILVVGGGLNDGLGAPGRVAGLE